MISDTRKFIYCLDQMDTITHVNDDWIEFAMENAQEGFVPNLVIGQPLWNFINSSKVQHLYSIVFGKARQGLFIHGLPYRCDAPDRRRFMEMDLLPADDAIIQIKSTIVREEAREYVPLLSDFRDMSSKILTICSFCKKVRIGENHWEEIEEVIKLLGLAEAWPLPQLSHGVCEKCFDEWSSFN